MMLKLIVLSILINLIPTVYNQSCLSWINWQDFKRIKSLSFYDQNMELIACNNFNITSKIIMNNNNAVSKINLAPNAFSHWALQDGKLHKGHSFGDSSYAFGRKRSLSTNSSLYYYNVPYRIHSATPGYPYKVQLSYTSADLKDQAKYPGKNWFMTFTPMQRDQGICANCWAFAAAAAISGQINKKYNLWVDVSVQQLTDCSSNLVYGNNGCNGGNVWNAFRYVFDNGIIRDEDYPFVSNLIGIPGKCRFKNGLLDGKPYTGKIYNVTSFIWANQGDDKALMEVLDQYGPAAVTFDSSDPSFTSYYNGYYAFQNGVCDNAKIDHNVLLVGYYQDPNSISTSYWKIRNQWSVAWSSNDDFDKLANEMKVSSIRNNNCGISSYALVPLID